ncbi:MAG: ATP synthase F1 subunit delta [Pseudobdellovibrionaceae bacterium]
MSSSASGASSLLARRYAASLIDVASRAGALDPVERDMASLAQLLATSEDFRFFLGNPVFSKDRQFAVMADVVKKGGYHQLVVNFLGVLVQNRRLGALSAILLAFVREMDERRGVAYAQVKVASPLSGEQEQLLRTMLSDSIHKTVSLEIQVDPSILGGMVVTIGSHMIDDSVSSKLARLKLAMTANSNSINASTKEVV